jgi:hypothetical protein
VGGLLIYLFGSRFTSFTRRSMCVRGLCTSKIPPCSCTYVRSTYVEDKVSSDQSVSMTAYTNRVGPGRPAQVSQMASTLSNQGSSDHCPQLSNDAPRNTYTVAQCCSPAKGAILKVTNYMFKLLIYLMLHFRFHSRSRLPPAKCHHSPS